MNRAIRIVLGATAWIALPVTTAALMAPVPAHAQFSDGYKFLEAVRKKDGAKVEEMLGKPGTTIIGARDVTNGEGALHIVVERRDLTWLRYLLAKGADANMHDDHSVTPLQVATNLGWLEGVQTLVANGADTEQADDSGETPLITAVHTANIDLMRILLKAGADPDRADNSGRSARDYAKLSTKSEQLLDTIKTYAKKRAASQGGPVYGPTL